MTFDLGFFSEASSIRILHSVASTMKKIRIFFKVKGIHYGYQYYNNVVYIPILFNDACNQNLEYIYIMSSD